MSLLRACAPQADSDAVLEWLKLAQTVPGSAVSGHWLSRWKPGCVNACRRSGRIARPGCSGRHAGPGICPAGRRIGVSALQKPRSLAQWLTDLQTALQQSGQWDWLHADAAGQAVLQALHLQPGALPLASDARDWNQPDLCAGCRMCWRLAGSSRRIRWKSRW